MLGRETLQAVLAIAGLALLCNAASLFVPLFNMQVFNRVLPTRDITTLGSLAIGLSIGTAMFAVLELLRSLAQEALAARVSRRLSVDLIASVMVAKRPEALLSEAMADLEQVRTFLASRACMAPFDIAWSPILIFALLLMHWALGLFALACVLLMTTLNFMGDLMARRSILAANAESASALRSASEGVNAAEAVVAMGMMPVLARRWQQSQANASRSVRRALLRARGVSALTTAARASMTGAMVALGLALTLNGFASSGSMVAANMVLARLLMPFVGLAALRRQWIEVIAAYRRIEQTLSDGRVEAASGAFPAPVARLVVDKLVYVPPGADRAVLRNISFTVEPGEAVAFVGPSSAGKSTLARAIVGLLQPSAGGVYLDGSSTAHWARADMARHVGYCPQRPTLIDESIADNISALQPFDAARVVAAAKRVGLHSVIAALPCGYATQAKADVLSGGQRQKLALARALYARPKLLVLDEPSAFLDEQGEADLIRLLQSLRDEGVTLITVTHRPTLLKAMSKVLVMRDGSMVQYGSPREVSKSIGHGPVQFVRAANDQAKAS